MQRDKTKLAVIYNFDGPIHADDGPGFVSAVVELCRVFDVVDVAIYQGNDDEESDEKVLAIFKAVESAIENEGDGHSAN